MKRTLALFLTLCMALSMFSFPAFAAEADVAVLDEAALVETETNNEPVADVTAPTEAVEAPVAADLKQFTVEYDGLPTGWTQDGNDLTYTAEYNGTEHGFLSVKAIKDKDTNTDLTTDPLVKVTYSIGNDEYSALPTNTVRLAQSGVAMTVTVSANGYETWTGMQVINVTKSTTIKPNDFTVTTEPADPKFGDSVNVKLSLTADDIDNLPAADPAKSAVLADMQNAFQANVVGYYSAASCKVNEKIADLSKYAGDVYVKATVAGTASWDGGTFTKKFTISPSDKPLALAFDAPNYTFVYGTDAADRVPTASNVKLDGAALAAGQVDVKYYAKEEYDADSSAATAVDLANMTAGEYVAVATWAAGNSYTTSDENVAATAAVTVTKADANITLKEATYAYDSAKSYVGSDLVTVPAGVASGKITYTLSGTLADGTAYDPASGKISAPGTYTLNVVLKGDPNYNDETKTFEVSIVNSQLTVSTTAVDATYGKADEDTLAYAIEETQKKIQVQYGAPAQTATVDDDYTVTATAVDADGVTVTPDTTKAVGTYTVKFIVTPTADGAIKDYAPAELTVDVKIVGAEAATKPVVENATKFDAEFTYDGKVHTVAEFTTDAKVIENDKEVPFKVTLDGKPLTADQYELRVTKGGAPVKEIKNAGEYKIYAVVPAQGTTAEAVSAEAITVTIGKADPVFTVKNVSADYDMQDHKDLALDISNVSLSGVNGEKIDFTYNEEDVTDGTDVTMTLAVATQTDGLKNGKCIDAGKYTITATWNDATYSNYNTPKTATGTLTINAVGNPVLTLEDETVTYTGKTLKITPATVSGDQAGAASRITYKYVSGDTTSSNGVTAAGVYTVTATMPQVGNQKKAEATANFTVEKATPGLKFANETKEEKYTPTLTLDGTANMTGTTTGIQSDVTYAWTFNGKALVDENGKAITTATLAAANVNVGTYTVTASLKMDAKKYTDEANYNDAEDITKTIVVRGVETDLDQIPAPTAANVKLSDGAENPAALDPQEIPYGAVLADVPFMPVAAVGSTMAGTWRIVPSTEGEQAAKQGKATFNLEFVPEDPNYAAASGNNDVEKFTFELTVGKAALTDDDVQIDAYVGKYDGKAHGVNSVVVTGKFDTDKFNVTYGTNKTGPWSATTPTFTEAGTHIVYVKVADTLANYKDDMVFTAKVEIGKDARVLQMNDLHATYSLDKTVFHPEVTLSGGGETIVVPDKYLEYSYAKWTANEKQLSYTLKDSNLSVTEDGKPYYVKVKIKDSVLNNEYKSYSIKENSAVANLSIAMGTVPADKISAKLATYKEGDKELGYTYKFNGTATVSNVVAYNADSITAAGKTGIQVAIVNNSGINGTGAFKPATQLVEVGMAATYVFTPDDSNFAPVEFVLNPKVLPMDLKTATDVKLSADSVPYGTDPAEVVINADGKVMNGSKELAGTWKLNVEELEIGTKEYSVVYVAESGAVNYNVIKNDGTAYTVTLKVTKGDPELKLSDTSKLYDGTAAAVTVESKSDAKVDLTWYDAAGKQLDRAPIDPGKYSVQASVQETTKYMAQKVKADYTIEYNDHYFGVEGFVTRLYSVALGREPEQEGYTKWVNGMKSKEYTPEFVSYGFIFSKEFINKKYDNATFLKIMYSTFMDREPDASGYNMWLNGLNSGEFSREDVFQGFVKSREFTNICARYGL